MLKLSAGHDDFPTLLAEALDVLAALDADPKRAAAVLSCTLKLVCIDLQPYTTTQAPERSDILKVGGFRDAVFSVVAAFLADGSGRSVAEVEKVEL